MGMIGHYLRITPTDNYARLVDFFVAAARDDDAIITYIA